MNYNLSPKQRALQQPDFPKAHRSLIESDVLEYSLQVALAQYVEEQARCDQHDPASKYWKIAGAHGFLFTLRNLVEVSTAPKAVDTVNLTQNLK